MFSYKNVSLRNLQYSDAESSVTQSCIFCIFFPLIQLNIQRILKFPDFPYFLHKNVCGTLVNPICHEYLTLMRSFNFKDETLMN